MYQRIRDLREDHDLTQKQIAQMLGYANEYHFIRLFKTATGTPPGTWRKRN